MKGKENDKKYESNQDGSKYNINKAYIMINELKNSVNLKDNEVFLIKYKNLLEELENVWYNHQRVNWIVAGNFRKELREESPGSIEQRC